jgi:type VI secretion system protein ImpA
METLENVRGIEAALQTHVSAVQLPNFSDLKNTLSSMLEILAPHVAHAAGPSPGIETSPGPTTAGAKNDSAPSTPGRISSRQDVLRALEQIRQYYKQHEPASPIPLMVHRLERMVPMTFLEIMTEIAPDGVNQVTTIIGPQS